MQTIGLGSPPTSQPTSADHGELWGLFGVVVVGLAINIIDVWL